MARKARKPKRRRTRRRILLPVGLLMLVGFLAVGRWVLMNTAYLLELLGAAEQRAAPREQAGLDDKFAPTHQGDGEAAPPTAQVLPFREEIELPQGERVAVPEGRFVLVRSPEGIGAVIFTGPSQQGDVGRAYRWYFAPGTEAGFHGSEVEQGEGEVFAETHPGLQVGSRPVVKRGSGEPSVRVGPLRLDWLPPDELVVPAGEPLAVAVTDAEQLEELDVHDPALAWHGEL